MSSAAILVLNREFARIQNDRLMADETIRIRREELAEAEAHIKDLDERLRGITEAIKTLNHSHKHKD